MKKSRIGAVLIFFTAITLLAAGCNTLRGVGQDIEKGGEAIQKAAKP